MSEFHLKDIFNLLPGTWAMERHIQNRGGIGLFKGVCHFSRMDDGRLLSEEEGDLDMYGNVGKATSKFIYELRNDQILMIDNNQRPGTILHELDFVAQGDERVAKHCHLCNKDTYDLTFTMDGDHRIQMNYVVKGPQKDYAMQTTLIRQP